MCTLISSSGDSWMTTCVGTSMERRVLMIETCMAVVWVKESLPVSKQLARMAMKGSLIVLLPRMMKRSMTIRLQDMI
jgi:hypothetical protein